jgi:acetoacetyl-CoA synthetase
MAWLRVHRGLEFADYNALWEWSTTDLTGFWSSIWEYFDLPGKPDTVVTSHTMPGATWFPGTSLNYAEQVLRLPGIAPETPVVFGYSQTRQPVTLTAEQLRAEVARVATGLRGLGVGRGDRVAAYMPNIPETMVLLLATVSLGAIFSSCAPEFGTRSVTDRWQQISPKVLFAIDGYRYGDKVISRSSEVEAIVAALPSLEHVERLSYLDNAEGLFPSVQAEPLTFEQVPFAHPLYVLYSSGTTGLPKPIVHGHGGVLLEHLKMLALHHDLGPGDRFSGSPRPAG